MSQKPKVGSGQPTLLIDSEVARQVRQHARSSSRTEICGVLIGQDRNSLIEVQACIPGVNAEEAGAHVTFTQDTWEHIYKVKDKEYPEHRIVGWYHSHPGFGVFLSDHDTFIHKNFFSSPGQVAWVFDPHSDEEGCFGWVGGRIERLARFALVDRHGGECVNEAGSPEQSASDPARPETPNTRRQDRSSMDEPDYSSLQRLATNIFSYLSVLLLGFLLAWYVFPRVMIMPVPVDPRTGQPLASSDTDSKKSEDHSPKPDRSGAKGDDVQPNR
jgi:proteasome lid subunit RPN8/RPN11